METTPELQTLLEKLDKKLDKVLTMQTKIAKALHLLPVTEKEERALQIQQRTNLNQAAKITAELDAMENKTDESVKNNIDISLYQDNTPDEEVYAGIIGDDIFGGK